MTLLEPFPILAYESEHLKRACDHLKLESRRLLRVFYVCATKLVRKIFCLCLWLYLCRHQTGPRMQTMEKLLKDKLLRLTLLIETPKEEVLEILPFSIAKAILLIIEAKVTESLA